jgi:hypothetical protein
MDPPDKEKVTVNIDIRPGTLSPAQKAAWRRFWSKLIAGALEDMKKSDSTGVTRRQDEYRSKKS